MGKEQGDHLPSEPTVLVMDNGDGEVLERVVYTPADEVQARAEGWEPKGQQTAETASEDPPGGQAASAPEESEGDKSEEQEAEKPAGRRSSGGRRDSAGEAASTQGNTG